MRAALLLSRGETSQERQPPKDLARLRPLPAKIERLLSTQSAGFSAEARQSVANEARRYVDQLVQSATAIKEGQEGDLVSAQNVDVAAESLYLRPRSRARKVAGIVGGIFVGAGISGLLTVLQGAGLPGYYLLASFVFSTVGAFLVAFGFDSRTDFDVVEEGLRRGLRWGPTHDSHEKPRAIPFAELFRDPEMVSGERLDEFLDASWADNLDRDGG